MAGTGGGPARAHRSGEGGGPEKVAGVEAVPRQLKVLLLLCWRRFHPDAVQERSDRGSMRSVQCDVTGIVAVVRRQRCIVTSSGRIYVVVT